MLATPFLLWRSVRTGRYRHGWRERLFGPCLSADALEKLHRARSAKRPIVWLHGVSVGEVLLLQPVVEKLKQQFPEAVFCISSTTDTGLALAQDKFCDADVFRFPLDFSWAISRALRILRPNIVLLAELELWPNLLALCEGNQIPVAVINGRLSQRSQAGYSRLAWLTRPMFSRLKLVCAASQDYASRFVHCGTPNSRVVTTGSIKFDNVRFERNSASIEAFRELSGLKQGEHTVFLAGSTQLEEERAAVDAYFSLREQNHALKLIVAPRHPERTNSVVELVRDKHPEATILLRSNLQSPVAAEAWDVLVIDCVGELSHWWGLADIALVGGTFGSRGGQNMIEPAALGCNVVFGPSTRNFRDAVTLLLNENAATELAAEEDLLPWLRQQLSDPAAGKARAARAIALIRAQQGALSETIRQIAKILPPQQ